LVEGLAEAGRVLLTGPINPDGDSIGACLALQRVLRGRGIACDVAGDIPPRYAWIPGAAAVLPDAAVQPVYDAVVVLDGDRHRLPAPVLAAFEAATLRGIADHHMSTAADGYDLFWVDGRATSTCEMLYSSLDAVGQPLDAELATQIYVGAIFDTGGFRYSNTTPATHRMAARLIEAGVDHAEASVKVLMERSYTALRVAAQVFDQVELHCGGAVAVSEVSLSTIDRHGIDLSDLEGVVESLVHIVGVQVAALLIERPEGAVKISLRSRGAVDVCAVAKRLTPTGGGHHKAAGAYVPDALSGCRAAFLAAVAEQLQGSGPSA
jgi:phosphoesterase RecJ-like protein